MKRVAAIYVDPLRGPYRRLPDVDVWGWGDVRQAGLLDCDAARYDGPHPVVAHPPCGPWGLFAWNYKGGEGAKSCGPRAVEQVRRFGGVLEHPQGSQLWKHCGLPGPRDGADSHGGYTLQVQQVDWGHPAVKPTWLYVCRVRKSLVPPMPPAGSPTHCMVRLRSNCHDLPELPKAVRHLTPEPFARWLVRLAREVA